MDAGGFYRPVARDRAGCRHRPGPASGVCRPDGRASPRVRIVGFYLAGYLPITPDIVAQPVVLSPPLAADGTGPAGQGQSSFAKLGYQDRCLRLRGIQTALHASYILSDTSRRGADGLGAPGAGRQRQLHARRIRNCTASP